MATLPNQNLPDEVEALKRELQSLKQGGSAQHQFNIEQFNELSRKFSEMQKELELSKQNLAKEEHEPQEERFLGNYEEETETLHGKPSSYDIEGQVKHGQQQYTQQHMPVQGAKGTPSTMQQQPQSSATTTQPTTSQKQPVRKSSIPTRKQDPRPNRPRPLTYEKRKELIENKPTSLAEVFQREPIEEIAFRNWQQRRTILIGDDKQIERSLMRISKHNVHMLPVVSKSAGGIVGTIDVLDIIHALIKTLKSSGSDNLTIQQRVRREFMTRGVHELISKGSFVISTHATLWDAVKGFVESGQDRFVIVDREVPGKVGKFAQAEYDIDGVLTLSDVLKFLVANSMFMKEEPSFSKTLKELGIKLMSPRTIESTEVVAEAFAQMSRYSHDGLAVVDESGVLIGNLSACDLKGVTRVNCPILNTSVADFIMRDQKREWFYRPLALDINDTLYHTIHQFVSLGKQRFYFVDNNCRPIGEISRQDVIRLVWKIIQHAPVNTFTSSNQTMSEHELQTKGHTTNNQNLQGNQNYTQNQVPLKGNGGGQYTSSSSSIGANKEQTNFSSGNHTRY